MAGNTKKKTEKWYDQSIRYGLYAMPVVIPAIFSPAFHTVFSAPKLAALHVLTLLILLFWGAKVFIEEKLSGRRGWLNWALLTYAIISVITTIFSVAFYTSLYGAQGRFLGIFTLLNFLVIPLLVWNFLKKKEVMTMLWISVSTAGVLSLYGIAQFFGLFQERFNWSQAPAERVFGTIGHGNHFGAYLGMHFLLGLFLLPTLKEKKYKWLLTIGLVLQAGTLLLTGSRGAFVATAIALVIALMVLAYKKWSLVKAKISKWLLPTFILISIAITAAVVFQNDLRAIPLIDRTLTTVTSVQEGILPDRLSWWKSSIDMIQDRPWFGFGLSTYRDIYNQYRRTDYQTLEAGGQEDFITPEAAHNEYLTIAATQGIIGLAAFIALVILTFWTLDKLLFSRTEEPFFYPVLGIKAALLVYLLQVFISFGVIATLTMFYLFLGAGIALAEKRVRNREFIIRGITKYILVLFLLSGISTAAIGTYREATAEIYYKDAQVYEQKGDVINALQSYEKMMTAKPFEYAYYQAYGDFALTYAKSIGLTEEMKLDLLGRAILNYENALLVNNLHPSTYYNLGVAYLQTYAYTGDPFRYEEAVYNFEQAVAKAPNNALYPYQSGRAFLTIETDDARQKAAELFQKTLEIRSPYRDAEQALEQVQKVLTDASAQSELQTGR